MSRSNPWWRWAVAALAVGVLWVAVYAVFTSVYPNDLNGLNDLYGPSAYRYRDDALITLSHARGLVDIGTVSVSVSGSRVEGFSAPLQFGLAVGYYELGGHSYQDFLDGQVFLSTFLLGASAFAIVALGAPKQGLVIAAVIATAVAIPLFATYSFFAWHSSGMENSLTNALAAASVASIALAQQRRWMLPLAGIVVALFALTRVEFFVHALPLLGVAVIWMLARGLGWRKIALLVVPAFVVVAVLELVRYRYFGSISPNTADAQGLSVGQLAKPWVTVMWPILLPLGYLAIRAIRSRSLPKGRQLCDRTFVVIGGGALVLVLALVRWQDSRGRLDGIHGLTDSSTALGLVAWGAIVVGLALLVRARFGLVQLLLATLVVTGIGHILFFGPARLATERVVSFMLVPLVLLAATLALEVNPARIRQTLRSDTARRLTVSGFVFSLLGLGVLVVGLPHLTRRTVLCCDVTPLVNPVLTEAAAVKTDTGLPVVTVANPDLGTLSLRKQVNIVDLGKLGDPILARLRRSGDSAAIVDYLQHYAFPDVVEAHADWSCQYAQWLKSAEFRSTYLQVQDDPATTRWISRNCRATNEDLRGGIWVRKDLGVGEMSREVSLSRTLAQSPTVDNVRRALETCPGTVAWSCEYVTRSVYRNLRAFERAGTLSAVADLFRVRRSGPYDVGVLMSRDVGDWYLNPVRYLLAPTSSP